MSILAAVNAITFAIAIRYISPASVQFLYPIVPILVVIFSWFLLHQKTSANKIFGVVVGFVGVIVVALSPVLAGESMVNFNATGIFLVLLGSICFALYTVLSKRAQDHATPGDILMGTAVATLVSQILLMLLTSTPLTTKGITLVSFGSALIVGSVGTAVFYWLYQYIVKISTPLTASVIQYILPFFGALWAYIILGNTILPLAVFGGILAVVGAGQVNDIWHQLIKGTRKI